MMDVDLFRVPGEVLHVPAGEVAAWLAARPGYHAIERIADLGRAPPPADAVLLAQTPRYVLFAGPRPAR